MSQGKRTSPFSSNGYDLKKLKAEDQQRLMEYEQRFMEDEQCPMEPPDFAIKNEPGESPTSSLGSPCSQGASPVTHTTTDDVLETAMNGAPGNAIWNEPENGLAASLGSPVSQGASAVTHTTSDDFMEAAVNGAQGNATRNEPEESPATSLGNFFNQGESVVTHTTNDDVMEMAMNGEQDGAINNEPDESPARSLGSPCSQGASAVTHTTNDDVMEADVNGAQGNTLDTAPAAKVVSFKDACEQFFSTIGACVSHIKFAVYDGKEPDRKANVIYATGGHITDYLFELYCIAIFLQIMLDSRKTIRNYDEWLERIFTDGLNVMQMPDSRVLVKYVDRSNRSEYIQMKENLHIKCKVTIDSLTSCLRHVRCQHMDLFRKREEVEKICHSQNNQIDLQDDANFFTEMLENVNIKLSEGWRTVQPSYQF